MNVNINIVTTQFNELGEENVIKSNVDGTLYQKKDHKYIIYKEIENNEETTTSLKIEEEQITIKRFGALDSTLRFKVGKAYKRTWDCGRKWYINIYRLWHKDNGYVYWKKHNQNRY